MRALAIILLLTSACSYESDHPLVNEIRISSVDFTPTEQEIIVSAVDKWCEASGRLCLPVTITTDSPNVTKVGWRTKNGACAWFHHAEGAIRVSTHIDCGDISEKLMIHEVGHLLRGQIGHTSDPDTVMFTPVRVSKITQTDIDFVSIRR
jgi:hypothetical protein